MLPIKINTNEWRLRAAGPARPKTDYRDKTKQAVSLDGRPIWLLRLHAYDLAANDGQGSEESIWVEVFGDKPEVTADELVTVTGLVFAPWIAGPAKKEHKIVRNFRADAVVMVSANGKAAHAS